ncbi:hypothetical protein [Lacunimicrobium album]
MSISTKILITLVIASNLLTLYLAKYPPKQSLDTYHFVMNRSLPRISLAGREPDELVEKFPEAMQSFYERIKTGSIIGLDAREFEYPHAYFRSKKTYNNHDIYEFGFQTMLPSHEQVIYFVADNQTQTIIATGTINGLF